MLTDKELAHLVQRFYICCGNWLRCHVKQQKGLSNQLGLPQYKVLLVVKSLKICSISVLSREMEVSKGTMSATLNKLVEEGLVKRTNSTRDRRTIFIELTPAGMTLVESMEEGIDVAFSQLIQEMDMSMKQELLHGITALNLALKNHKKNGCQWEEE